MQNGSGFEAGMHEIKLCQSPQGPRNWESPRRTSTIRFRRQGPREEITQIEETNEQPGDRHDLIEFEILVGKARLGKNENGVQMVSEFQDQASQINARAVCNWLVERNSVQATCRNMPDADAALCTEYCTYSDNRLQPLNCAQRQPAILGVVEMSAVFTGKTCSGWKPAA